MARSSPVPAARPTHRACLASAVLGIAALLTHCSQGVGATPEARVAAQGGSLPIPDPPDVKRRQDELRSYSNSSCSEPVPRVTDAQFVLSVIAKGEAPYIEEWVMYHLFLGVDLIYLYDNEATPTYHLMFACNPRVRVIYFPTTPRYTTGVQLMAQKDFMRHYNYLHKWAMLPNADEFIVLKHHHDVKDFAAQYINDRVPGVGLQWLMFGHNGNVHTADEPLSMRFTRRSVKLTYTVKTMFGCAFVRRHDHAHYPIYNHTNRNGKVMIGSDPTFSISAHARHSGHVPEYMQIDAGVAGAMMFHYYNKSLEECISRREFRLRPDVACGRKCPQITEHERARRKSVTAQLVRVFACCTHAMLLL